MIYYWNKNQNQIYSKNKQNKNIVVLMEYSSTNQINGWWEKYKDKNIQYYEIFIVKMLNIQKNSSPSEEYDIMW